MSIVWCFLMILGLLSAIIERKPERLLQAISEGGKDTIEYLFTLLGIMAFWSGIYNVVEKTGVISSLSQKIARPVFGRLFRKRLRKAEEEAVFASIVANLLGLGNAATVWGLKAMQELKKDSIKEGYLPSNIATFLILLCSGLTIFPTSIINLRAAYGSENAAVIWFPALIISSICTVVALILDRIWGEK